ncbi:hypothetical protein M3Y95_01246700 [Aphelenchoides besseyi]|nr:hypothetical protein M3Y95_01246700 [Aphelenchoides besseyi]
MSLGLRFLVVQLMFVELGFSISTPKPLTKEEVNAYKLLLFSPTDVLSEIVWASMVAAFVLAFNLIPLIIVFLLHRSRSPHNPTDGQLEEVDENCEVEEKTTVKKKNKKVEATKKPMGLKVKRKSSSTDTPSEFIFDGNQTKETGTVMMLQTAEKKATSSNTNLESPK